MDMDAKPPIDVQIRTNLARYLAGEMTLDEFEDWFVPATWDIERRDNPAAESLTAAILLALSECNGDERDANIRNLRLQPILSEQREPATTRHD